MPVNVSGGGLFFDAGIDDDSLENALAKINADLLQTYETQRKAQETATKQQKEYATLILATGSAFKSLDNTVQAQLKSLAALNTSYRQVADARKTLDERYSSGVIGVGAYNQALAQLMGQERTLSASIGTVTADLAANDKVMQAANGSILQKMALLDQLKQKYLSLSETDRGDISITSPIINQIRTLDSEIKTIQSSFNAVEQQAVGSINERVQALAKLKNEYASLSAGDRESDLGKGMLESIYAVEAEVQKLNNSLTASGRNALGSLNERSAALAKLKADYSALSEADRNSSIGQNMLADLHAVDNEVQQISRSFTALQQNAGGSINEKVQALQRLREQYNALSATDRTGQVGKGMLQNIQQLDKEVRNLNTDFSKTNSIASQVAVAIGGYLSLQGVTGLVRQIVQVRGEFEQLEVTFRVLLGSKEKADKLLAEATTLAATTPFSLLEVSAGAKQLLAYGFSAETVTDTLKTLGNVAAGTGQPLSDIVYLYGTLQTQGRAYTQDIRQFTGRGIPIIAELAKQFGVTKEEVSKLVEAGQVGFPEVEKAFQSMTGAGGQFFNLMEEQSKTVTGQISNLGDAFDVMLNNIGKSNEGIITGSIAGLKTLVDNYQTVIDILEVLVLTYGAYRAAVIAQAAYTAAAAQITAVYSVETKGLALAETLQATASGLATRAQALLNTTMLANPFVLVATVLAGLTFALYEMRDSTTAAERATASLRDEEAAASQQRDELKNKTQELVAIIQSETSTRYAQLDAFKQLQALYPSYLNNVDLQAFKTIGAKDAQLAFNRAIEDNDLKRLENDYASLQTKIEAVQKTLNAPSVSAGTGGADYGKIQAQKDLDTLTEKEKLLSKAIADRKQAQFEANTAPADLKSYYENILNSLQKQRGELEKSVDLSKKAGTAIDGWRNSLSQITLDRINKQIDDFTAKLKGLTGATASVKTNTQLIDETKSLDALNAIRSKISEDYNKEQDNSRRAQLAKDLEYADKRKKLLDVYGADKTGAKEQASIESKINEILNQRTGILDKIAGLQRDSKQSGLLQDQSEIDKIREKYDAAFKAIDEYNQKIIAFNAKNKTNVQGIGIADVDKLRNAEAIEVANAGYKQDSAAYIASLDDKKKAFEDFEKIQQQGIDEQTQYAKVSYREQLGDFTSYLDFLKSQASDLKFKIELEPDNIGYQNSLLAVNKAINEESNKQQADILQQRIADYASALQSAATFADKKKQIEAKYNKDVLAIAANASDKQIADRLAILKQDRDNAIDAAKDEVYQKTAIYKRLSEDVVQFTRAQLKAQIAAIQDVLKQTKNISPEVKAQLQKQLGDFTIELHVGSSQAFREDLAKRKKEIESELANNSDKLSADQIKAYADQLARINQLQKENKDIGFGASAADFQKFAGYAKSGADGLRNIASSLTDVDKGLADAIGSVADLGDGLSNALSGAAAIASGDVAGAISSITTAISGAIKYFGEVAKSAKDSKKDLQDYQNSLITGETAYNELLRDRARTQGDIADLTIKELQAREDMLALQKQQAQADYNKLLQQIQDTGKQITGEHSEKTGGLSAALQYGLAGAIFGKKTKTVQDLAGIGDADYAELEKLFTEGKLDDATKEWFTQLKTVQDELDSIGESADQAADQLNQALTGTTADSITDDIVKGFADGKRASADFADDFQSLMQNAILQSLKYNALQQPLQDFYKQFAADVDSDNALTDNEITGLQNTYNGIIDNASKQFEQLQNITKVDFSQSNASSSPNNLQGAVKNITEESAQLLAGQFGGLRLTNQQIMQISQQQLNQLIIIANYAADIPNMKAILQDMNNRGIKIRA